MKMSVALNNFYVAEGEMKKTERVRDRERKRERERGRERGWTEKGYHRAFMYLV